MEDIVGVFANISTCFYVTNIAFNEMKPLPLWRGYEALHFVEIMLVAGRKIVEASYFLIQLEQGFKKI